MHPKKLAIGQLSDLLFFFSDLLTFFFFVFFFLRKKKKTAQTQQLGPWFLGSPHLNGAGIVQNRLFKVLGTDSAAGWLVGFLVPLEPSLKLTVDGC